MGYRAPSDAHLFTVISPLPRSRGDPEGRLDDSTSDGRRDPAPRLFAGTVLSLHDHRHGQLGGTVERPGEAHDPCVRVGWIGAELGSTGLSSDQQSVNPKAPCGAVGGHVDHR